jgi:hypothetical protein
LVTLIFWCLFSHQQAAGHPSESRADEFEDAYTRWLTVKRDFPKLKHDDCAPNAATFGISEHTASAIRDRVRRDFERGV